MAKLAGLPIFDRVQRIQIVLWGDDDYFFDRDDVRRMHALTEISALNPRRRPLGAPDVQAVIDLIPPNRLVNGSSSPYEIKVAVVSTTR